MSRRFAAIAASVFLVAGCERVFGTDFQDIEIKNAETRDASQQDAAPSLPIENPHPWPMQMGGNAKRQWRSELAGPSTVPTKAWTTKLAGNNLGFPVVSKDGTAFVPWYGDDTIRLVAVASDGTEKWSRSLPPLGLALGADDTLFVAATDGLFALDSENGETRWSMALPTLNVSIFRDGSVLAMADDGAYRFDTRGEPLWKVPLTKTAPSAAPWPVAIGDDNAAFILWDDNTVLKVADDGTLAKKVTFRQLGDSPSLCAHPSIGDDGRIYVACGRSLHALTADLAPAGEYAFDGINDCPGTPAVVGTDRLYMLCWGVLIALSLPELKEVWRFTDKDLAVDHELLLDRNGTLFLEGANTLFAIDSEKRVKWSISQKAFGMTSAALGPNGDLYVSDGELYRYRL